MRGGGVDSVEYAISEDYNILMKLVIISQKKRRE